MATKTAVCGYSLAVLAVLAVALNFAATLLTGKSLGPGLLRLVANVRLPSYEGRSVTASHLWNRAAREMEMLGFNVYFFSVFCVSLGVILVLWWDFKRANSATSTRAGEERLLKVVTKSQGSVDDRRLRDRPQDGSQPEAGGRQQSGPDHSDGLDSDEGQGRGVDRASREEGATAQASTSPQQPPPLPPNVPRQPPRGDVIPWAQLVVDRVSGLSGGRMCRVEVGREEGVLLIALRHALGFLQVALAPFFPLHTGSPHDGVQAGGTVDGAGLDQTESKTPRAPNGIDPGHAPAFSAAETRVFASANSGNARFRSAEKHTSLWDPQTCVGPNPGERIGGGSARDKSRPVSAWERHAGLACSPGRDGGGLDGSQDPVSNTPRMLNGGPAAGEHCESCGTPTSRRHGPSYWAHRNAAPADRMIMTLAK